MSDIDIVKEFLVESHENLDRLDRDLIALEQDPTNREILASVFRTIHTIKGTSGFLAFPRLESVAHVGENLLARLRDGHLVINPELTTALLQMVDAVRQMLSSIEVTGSEGERDDTELIATLTQLQVSGGGSNGTVVELNTSENQPAKRDLNDATQRQRLTTASTVEQLDDDDDKAEALGRPEPLKAPDSGDVPQAARAQSASDSTIRVDVSLLDQLMNLVGELVLARNQVLQYTASTGENGLLSTIQRLNLITSELQEGVMKTRMQPIGNIWSKFPRTVRDVALSCGKQVRIEMEGKETELDKTIIEAIKDPLTHLVRNSVDHGIESPEARAQRGKDPEGQLLLRAFHEGGQVNIEIIDDGGGLNVDKIREKAVLKGLITSEQASRMSEREASNLIFMPGFSTAEKVTNVSGRGVGMDVVKTNIEKIGGTVDVQSKAGIGTTVRMKIPLTLAIIPALVVTSSGNRYAIPQINLLELVRLEGDQARSSIETVNGAPVYRLRGKLLPLVDLNRELRTGGQGSDARLARVFNIVVLQADDRQFGLIVDDVNDTEEIVVKPLAKELKGINVYAGATIMGDGKVALILDVLGLAQTAKVVGESRSGAMVEKEETNTMAASASDRRSVLLFQAGERGRMAIDLSLVARLEEFSRNSIEVTGGREAVQYRGSILPLIRISQIVGNGSRHEQDIVEGPVQAVVYSQGGRSLGLIVDRILDIVEESFTLEKPMENQGLLGSAVIQQQITDVLDVAALVNRFADGGVRALAAHA